MYTPFAKSVTKKSWIISNHLLTHAIVMSTVWLHMMYIYVNNSVTGTYKSFGATSANSIAEGVRKDQIHNSLPKDQVSKCFVTCVHMFWRPAEVQTAIITRIKTGVKQTLNTGTKQLGLAKTGICHKLRGFVEVSCALIYFKSWMFGHLSPLKILVLVK